MDRHYTEEKFIQAERELAVGEEAIKGRLKKAYRYFAILTEEDFPEHLKTDYRWIKERLTMKPPLRDRFTGNVVTGTVSRTLHFMKNKTAVAIAERIVLLRQRMRDFNVAEDARGNP